MRILVTGASGGLGRELIVRLLDGGYSIRAMSRKPPPPSSNPKLEWVQADLERGETLAKPLDGIGAVIHAASSPFSRTRQVDVFGTRRLMEEAKKAGVHHFVYISIVGIDRIPFPYYRHKVSAEQAVMAGGVPWTILRATQFHTLLGEFFIPTLFRFPGGFLPTDFKFQPIDTGEVADQLAVCLRQGASGRLPDIGGPKVHTLGDLTHGWMQAAGKVKRIRHVNLPGDAAAAFRQGFNTAPENAVGKIAWEDWLARKFGGHKE